MSEHDIPQRWQDPHTILRVLTNAATVAIVGLSPNELRASHFVGFYLRRHGYRVVPVNPREKTILGCMMGSNRFRLDMPRYVDLYLAGELKLDEMISARLPLESINDAFETMRRGKAARSVIVFE